MLISVEDLVKDNVWPTVAAGTTFELNFTFRINDEVDDSRADVNGELVHDQTPCTIWRLWNEESDHYLISRCYRENHWSMVKIYGLSNPNAQGFFIVVSEPIMRDMKNYFSLINRDIPALNDESQFLRPFRSLLDRIIALLDINHDFVLRHIDVLMIQTSEGSFEFKIGFISPNPQIRENLSSMQNASQIVRRWIDSPTNRASNNMRLLLAVMEDYDPACKYNLKMLRRSPIFLVNNKEALIDFVIKFDRVLSRQKSTIKIGVHKKLVEAFQIMNFHNIVGSSSKWYSIGHASVEIRNCINAVPYSVVNQVSHMVRGIRNIVAHIFQRARYLDYATVCDGIEQMSPGCWAALHFAAMEILPDEFIED